MILAVLLASLTSAVEAAPAPAAYSGRESRLHVAIPRLEETIAVDGALDDPAWQRAALLTDFSQYSPVDGRAAEQRTEVLVFYSPSAIHFGVRAYAPPGSVRASLAQRDRIDAEDSITILLSTFNDGRQAAAFMVNPLGVQGDGTLVEGVGRSQGEGFSGLATGREPPDLAPAFRVRVEGPAHRRRL